MIKNHFIRMCLIISVMMLSFCQNKQQKKENSYLDYAKKAQKTLIALSKAINDKDVNKAKELCSVKGINEHERFIQLDSIVSLLSKQSTTDEWTLRSWINAHADLIMNQEEKSYTWSGDTIKFSYGHDFQHQFYSTFVLDKKGRCQLVYLSTHLLK